jgi:hypothetical protein
LGGQVQQYVVLLKTHAPQPQSQVESLLAKPQIDPYTGMGMAGDSVVAEKGFIIPHDCSQACYKDISL